MLCKQRFVVLCVFVAAIGFGLLVQAADLSSVQVDRLRCDYLKNPLGIDDPQPELNWLLRSDERKQVQTAYQILVASSAEKLAKDEGDLWDSGRVASDQSLHIVYAGRPLASHQKCWWKVRSWDNVGKPTAWSEPAFWSMGILKPDEWQAKWIGFTKDSPYDANWKQSSPSPMFRKTFDVEKPIREATVSVCGLGFYELHLNGERVGKRLLDPSFTRYDKRVLYATYDVTKQLKQGKNAVGAMLGNGFYNSFSHDAWDFEKAPWRDQPRMLLQLRIVFDDGSVQTVTTDGTWQAAIGPIVRDSMRNGEVYDARREMPGWDSPTFDAAAWESAKEVTSPKGTLRAEMLPAAEVTETFKPVSVTEPKPGVFIVDAGQNLAGWAELKVSGPAGTRVAMRFGERLKKDGTFEENLALHVKQGPFQTGVYYLKGQGEETWEPRFTYYGFQYIEVVGFPGKPTVDNFTIKVVHTAFEKAGSFECSNALFNTIQKDTLWAYRSNFVDGYPTDCPHREKNGWTGDAQLAAEQAMYNVDNIAAYLKWLDDMKDEQQPDGNLPGIVPTSGWGYKWGNGPPWDSASILIPWYIHQYTGDTRVLADHYENMKRYVDFMTSRAKNHLISFGLGDWVPYKTKTPELVTSSGYYYVDSLIVSKAAALLGKADDAKKYADLAADIRTAFNKTLYKGDGLYSNGGQTSLSCAVYQGLVAPDEKAKVVEKLAENVKQQDYHIDTGILGAKYIFHTLSDNGFHDVAYRMASQTTAPSYGSWISRGGTTLWEDWGDGASRNHIMFGDISAWFYQTLGGLNIDPEKPAFKHAIIRPRTAMADWAKADHESFYGPIACHWRRAADGGLSMQATVPVNTTATIYVPGDDPARVTESGKPLAASDGLKFVKVEQFAGEPFVVVEAASGKYDFTVKAK